MTLTKIYEAPSLENPPKDDFLYKTTINHPKSVEVLNHQFICKWDNIFQEDFCSYLIDTFDRLKVFKAKRSDIVREDKQIDLQVFNSNVNEHLMTGLSLCLNSYLEFYPHLQELIFYSNNNLMQKTEPMQGYHSFHHERTGLHNNKRCLVWTIYCNDVDEGGETEFLYQQLKVKPKRGTVCIFPAGFTHQHRGNPPMSTKYIITGWFNSNFPDENIQYYEYKKDL